MKVKAIKQIDQFNCFHGFTPEEVIRLNNRKTITIDKLRRDGADFVEVIEEKPKKEKE